MVCCYLLHDLDQDMALTQLRVARTLEELAKHFHDNVQKTGFSRPSSHLDSGSGPVVEEVGECAMSLRILEYQVKISERYRFLGQDFGDVQTKYHVVDEVVFARVSEDGSCCSLECP